jgi:hypothetical protein
MLASTLEKQLVGVSATFGGAAKVPIRNAVDVLC